MAEYLFGYRLDGIESSVDGSGLVAHDTRIFYTEDLSATPIDEKEWTPAPVTNHKTVMIHTDALVALTQLGGIPEILSGYRQLLLDSMDTTPSVSAAYNEEFWTATIDTNKAAAEIAQIALDFLISQFGSLPIKFT